ncbi:hypothetical protein F3N42_11200 [Marinihelvus fidelis]|uniref:Tetratricopeptide repeat protein n=2 Tax=Marinihelvus fidelis TaxID=2613842 RepID=A0A5N0TB81_9GAMM|nr:hypothetical protein F3N42_11200 [Marinihelvus fidelis]
MAANLSAAILNQDDPETVRDGAPAFLIMLDSFVEGSPDDPAMLGAAADLYAAYGVLFVDDPARAERLTGRSLDYGRRALCATDAAACGIADTGFRDYAPVLQSLGADDVPTLYSYSLSKLAWIQARAGDMGALAELPKAQAALDRVRELDHDYREAEVERYLGVLATIRPPALGGRFDEGRAYFERAIELSGGRDLGARVDFARYYARTLYERELHDQLLNEVISADPRAEGLTLLNVLAQREAAELLASADDYF